MRQPFSKNYSVTATLTWDELADSLVGTVSYPGLDCVGRWDRGWLDRRGQLHLREVIPLRRAAAASVPTARIWWTLP